MKLAVFFDGTWNEPSTRTNVWKLKQDLDCSADTDTKATYIEGIGTVKGKELLAGAFATDLPRQLGLGYSWLVKKILNAPKDEKIAIYLFGFSRGGYIAHTLSWLLFEVGVSTRFASAIPIVEAYAKKDSKTLKKLMKGGGVPLPKIAMLGLWDAVSSPHDFYRGYHDGLRAGSVARVYHAMATDERRKLYGAMQYASDRAVVQRWFSGVHKDVGGGYPEGECELSDVTLDWMKRKAVRCGLSFKTPLPKPPRRYDFSALTVVHNEETPLDPIRKRIYHKGQSIDRSVRDRVKTAPGYFPALAEVPSLLLGWLSGPQVFRGRGCVG